MATLWGLITGNSSLPIQAGNTLRDHMRNQNAGGGISIDRTFYTPFKATITENLSATITENLSANVTGDSLNASIKTFTKAQVST